METISQLTRSLSRISTNQAQLIAMMESRQPRNMMDIKTNIMYGLFLIQQLNIKVLFLVYQIFTMNLVAMIIIDSQKDLAYTM